MGTATNSLPVITFETEHLTEANWLAVPDFRDVCFYHRMLARPSSHGSAVILPRLGGRWLQPERGWSAFASSTSRVGSKFPPSGM